jgi:putative nucleotidyltransferase with HDIG domain
VKKEKIGRKLNFALKNLDSLPAMPAIAQRLLALPLNTEAGEIQMLRLIEQDPLLSAKMLGLANAPVMGIARRINSIQDAAMFLGLKRMKSVAIGIATMSELTNQPAVKYFDPHDLWTHSMAIAIVSNTLSRAMPKRIQPDENLIFLSGLLHDLGLMALHYLDSEASNELHRQLLLQPQRPINEIELELLGTTHGYIGAQLAQHWHLPNEIIQVAEHHHSSNISEKSFSHPLVKLIHFAEKLLPNFGIAEHTNNAISENDWREICIKPERAPEILALINELAIQIVQLPNSYEFSDSNITRIEHAAIETDQTAVRVELTILPLSPLKVLFRKMIKWLR